MSQSNLSYNHPYTQVEHGSPESQFQQQTGLGFQRTHQPMIHQASPAPLAYASSASDASNSFYASQKPSEVSEYQGPSDSSPPFHFLPPYNQNAESQESWHPRGRVTKSFDAGTPSFANQLQGQQPLQHQQQQYQHQQPLQHQQQQYQQQQQQQQQVPPFYTGQFIYPHGGSYSGAQLGFSSNYTPIVRSSFGPAQSNSLDMMTAVSNVSGGAMTHSALNFNQNFNDGASSVPQPLNLMPLWDQQRGPAMTRDGSFTYPLEETPYLRSLQGPLTAHDLTTPASVTLLGFGPAEGLQLKCGGTQKPPYPLCTIIAFAISTSPQRRLTLKEIYAWMLMSFPYYKSCVRNWKNTVRHTLSMNKGFVKAEKALTERGKGCHWTVDPSEAHVLLTKARRSSAPLKYAGVSTFMSKVRHGAADRKPYLSSASSQGSLELLQELNYNGDSMGARRTSVTSCASENSNGSNINLAHTENLADFTFESILDAPIQEEGLEQSEPVAVVQETASLSSSVLKIMEPENTSYPSPPFLCPPPASHKDDAPNVLLTFNTDHVSEEDNIVATSDYALFLSKSGLAEYPSTLRNLGLSNTGTLENARDVGASNTVQLP